MLDNGTVRCWGRNSDGELGYGNTDDIGDDETPGSAGPSTWARAARRWRSPPATTTRCAILDNGTVRCWGSGSDGQLGYGEHATRSATTRRRARSGPVDLGAGRTAVAITAGGSHTCALLDNGSGALLGLRRSTAELGYGNRHDIGDDETPGSVGPVDLGAGRHAVAITGGNEPHLRDPRQRQGALLGLQRLRASSAIGNRAMIGDDETPASVGSVNLGAGRTAVAISAGDDHTCALLDNGRVRCWGSTQTASSDTREAETSATTNRRVR